MLRAAQRAVDLLSGSGDLVWEARALGHRAKANLALGAVARADEDYARSEELFARAGQRLEYASALHDRGTTAFARGDLPAALALLDDAQQVVDELDVFEPELDVTRVQVLLAAELHRDALRVADEAVARSVRLHGSATRRGPSCCSPRPWPRPPRATPATAVSRSAEALRMFRHQQRAWWAARAELVLLQSRLRHRRQVGRPAARGHPARRALESRGRHAASPRPGCCAGGSRWPAAAGRRASCTCGPRRRAGRATYAPGRPGGWPARSWPRPKGARGTCSPPAPAGWT